MPPRLVACLLALATASTLSTARADAADAAKGGKSRTPAKNLLAWRPPALHDPVTVSASDARSRLYLDSGRDYVVKLPSRPLTAPGGLWIIGGHNVVVIGGEISVPLMGTTPDWTYGIFAKNQTGTLHVEGVRLDGAGLAGGVVLDQGAGATVQLEKLRVDIRYVVPPDNSIHPDIVQTWRGPYSLRIDRLTGFSTSKGFALQPHQYDVQQLGTWDLRHVNIAANGSSVILWKSDNSYQLDGGHAGYWRQDQQDFWIEPGRSWGWAWPDNAAWGNFQVGQPPSGDFVPAASVGTDYSSPGYRPQPVGASGPNRARR